MPGHACKLNKSLCGTMQAVELCCSLLGKSLKTLCFANSNYDNQIYLYNQATDFAIVCIVVDDLAFASSLRQLLKHLKAHLSNIYDLKLFDEITTFTVLDGKYHGNLKASIFTKKDTLNSC